MNHTKQLKDVQDVTWSADYAMEDDVRNQREKIKIKTSNALASLISQSLNLGYVEMPIVKYVQLDGE